MRNHSTGPDVHSESEKESVLDDELIEDLYPLSPMQQGMLFHTLLAPTSMVYVTQFSCTIVRRLHAPAFQRAWQDVVERHPILRTSFVWEGVDEPVQAVHRRVDLPCEIHDWRTCSSTEQAKRVEAFLIADRTRGFDLIQAPLMRLALLHLAEDTYQVVWTYHHVLLDGWSVALLLQEVFACYRARLEARDPGLRPPRRYREYITWLRRQNFPKAERYWRHHLNGATVPTPLLEERMSQRVADHEAYQVHTVSLSQDGSVALQSFTRRHRLTLSTLFFGIWGIVLSRYSGLDDVVTGVTISGRPTSLTGAESIVGLFINTLPARLKISPEQGVLPWLHDLQTQLVELGEFAYSPLLQIQKWCESPRGRPLFETLFVFENYPVNQALLPVSSDLTIRDVHSSHHTHYPLSLMVLPGSKIQLVFEYDRHRFSDATIERMEVYFQTVLGWVQQNPERNLMHCPPLSEREHHQVVVEWNRTTTAYPREVCLHHVIEKQVERTPKAVAVVFEQHHLTYHELNSRANQLAHKLRSLGVKPETRVGIFMERSSDMVVGILGILKAGGAYVPLDPTYPQERLAFMLADACVTVLVTQARLVDRLPPSSAQILCIDGEATDVAHEPIDNPQSDVHEANVAYMIYTSGSTGRPKGVMIPHRGICNRLWWMQEAYGLTAQDRVLQKTPFSFDVSVWELFWPLMTGACLVVARPGGHQDSGYLVRIMAEERITTMHFVPSMLQMWLHESGVEQSRELRRVICSGEALSPELVSRFMERLPSVQLHNLYGPTEASVDVSAWACERATQPFIVPIGRPIANTQLYVLDSALQPVPIGVAGELYIGGVGLARGYFQRPDVTAERFLPDPFAQQAGARLYRTGDRARWLVDGTIAFLGRLDYQVKIRGYRIELGEIESVLRQQMGVRDVVVLAREDCPGIPQLVAYVVLDLAQTVSAATLRQALLEQVPDYMVPAVFLMLDALPLMPNGKVDRKALPVSDGRRPQLGEAYVPPQTLLEETLAGIWRHVLGLTEVGIHDNFFVLGGDSIRSIQVVGLIKEKDLPCSLPTLFQHPTIAQLASALETSTVHRKHPPRSEPFSLLSPADRALLPADFEDAYPLSMLQAGMLYHNEDHPRSYHLIDSGYVKAPLDLPALRRSLEVVTARHSVLRTDFALGTFSEPLQCVHRTSRAILYVDDWRRLSPDEQEERLDAWLEVEQAAPFDITQAPLVRFHIHQRSDEAFQFTMTEHHAILDGWSVAVLFSELFRTYFALMRGTAEQSLPQVNLPYREFVAQERRALQSEDCRTYWTNKLAGRVGSSLSHSNAGFPAEERLCRQVIESPYSTELTGKLRRLAESLTVPLKSVLLAAHLRALALLTGSTEVVTGVVTHGRPEEVDADRVLGLFLNTLPFAMSLGHGTWADLVRAVFETERESAPFRHYPLAAIQKAVGARWLFDSLFIFTEYHVLSVLSQEEELNVLDWKTHAELNFPIEIGFGLDRPGLLKLSMAYDQATVSDETAASLVKTYRHVLEQMVADPHQSFEVAGVLSAEEQARVVRTWNRTKKDYPDQGFLPQLFERQVRRRPHAPAVLFHEQCLSYQELNTRANRLANALRSAGVGPDEIVGVCASRSVELVVALLGIVKAGAAYLPLDPDYPPTRLAGMLDDATPCLVLCQPTLTSCLPKHLYRQWLLDVSGSDFADYPDTNPAVVLHGDHVAYVLYTSGSTGRPKGVAVPHKGLRNRLLWMQDWFRLQEDEAVLQKTPYSFDVSAWEFFWPLIVGARLVVAGPGEHKDPERLMSLIEHHGVTTIHFVPLMLRAFLDAPGVERCAALQRVICSGEALGMDLQGLFFQRLKARLTNLYGPTEASIDVTVWDCSPTDHGTSVPIGHPIANTEMYILDQYLQPVPVGVPGEMYIGGIGLARGYLNQPDVTAAAFVPDPFGEAGGRLYRTGDIGRYRADGAIEYMGRRDHQVKIRGHRIELQEIESVLRGHAAIRDTVVVVREESSARKQIVAYVVLQQGGELTEAELRTFVHRQLPDYMVPAAVIFLDALPLSSNGKVDRKALPAIAREVSTSPTYVAPRTKTETLLAQMWAEVLRLKSVGIHENFFELGGDSIVSIQLVSRARQAGLVFTPRQLFQHQTIAALAGVVTGAMAVPSHHARSTEMIPLTPIQQWYFEQAFPNPHHWNQALLLDITRPVNAVLLEQAVEQVVTHHDAFQLRFVRDGQGWLQHLSKDALPMFSTCDLSHIPPEQQLVALEAQADHLQCSLDLTKGPLGRVALFTFGSDRFSRLLLVVHHLVIDGVSWRILLEDLWTVYSQLEATHPVRLPAKTTSYVRWAERLQDYAQMEQILQEKPYWLALARAQVKPLSVEDSTGDNHEASVESVPMALSEAETHGLLREIHSAYRTRTEEILLTVLARAVCLWNGGDVLLVDIEHHGREDVFEDLDLTRTVGWFTSIVPVLLHGAEAMSWSEALKTVKEQLRTVPNKGIGYGILRYVTGGEIADQLTAQQTSQISFNYLGQFDQGVSDSVPFTVLSESVGVSHDRRGRRPYEWDITAYVQAGRLHLRWSYSRARFRRETMETLVQTYHRMLQDVITHCLSPEAGGYTPSDFPLASLDQAFLNRVFAREQEIEEVYPATPLQEGLLFHSAYAPSAGLYLEQLWFRLEGTIDLRAFQQAWQLMIDRHPILRTAFVAHPGGAMLQIVGRHMLLPFTELDWSGVSWEEQDRQWQAFLVEDRAIDFEVSRAPLLRITVVRCSETSYRCVCSYHHALLDGWSLSVLFREVIAAYQHVRGIKETEVIASRPYRDYIAWLQSRDVAAAEAYWRKTLVGLEAATPLMREKHHVEGNSRAGSFAQCELRLSPDRATATKAFATKQRLTLNTLVQGTWALLLSRYGGTNDVLFGVTTSGRPAELIGVNSMLGLFINTLPFRVQIPEQMSVVTWLPGLMRQNLEMRQYEFAPLVQIQGWSDIPRPQPLFESLVVFENYPIQQGAGESGEHLKIADLHVEERAHYPISLIAAASEGEMRFRIQYDSNRFDEALIGRLLGHFQTLLDGLIADPDVPLHAVPMLTDTETRQILVEWNTTTREFPSDLCLHQLVEAQVERTPEAIAGLYERQSLTYRELNQRANQLSHHLRRLGVGPEVRVGLSMMRSLDLLVGILGILKAGGVYVPLDPRYPAERLRGIVEDAQMSIVVTHKVLHQGGDSQGRTFVYLDRDWPIISQEPTTNPAGIVCPEHAAYMIYTSGSTGSPKGVVVTHRNVVHSTTARFEQYHEPIRRFLLIPSFAFDSSVAVLFWTLSQGGGLVLPTEDDAHDSVNLVRLIAQEQISHLLCVPSLYAVLVGQCQRSDCASLHVVIVAGEACPQWLHDQHTTTLPGVAFFNEYGPTEATVWSTVYEATGREARYLVPIGCPIANTRLYILDAQQFPVPIGVPGELYIGGFGVARGYWGRPDLTAEKFLPHPFSEEPGARLYRTGDWGRYLPDQNIEFLGRRDHQVKIRGVRMELGEVEAVLGQHPFVRQAVVLAKERSSGEVRLVAYVVGKDSLPAVNDLRDYLRKRLPEPMVPAAFLFLQTLPVTPNGKLDRKALPDPGHPGHDPVHGYVPPQTEEEHIVADIWADVLGVQAVGRSDNFFDLGGHSLLATRVKARLQAVLQLDIPLAALFENPSLSDFARVIQTVRNRPMTAAVSTIQPIARASRMKRLGQHVP